MGIPIQNTYVYSLNFADDQVLLAQEHDDMEYMPWKLKEEYGKKGTYHKFREKTKYGLYGRRKSNFLDRFSKNTQNQISWKFVQWERSCAMQTDKHEATIANSSFSQFCERAVKNPTFWPHPAFICCVWISQKKQRLFLHTALTDWFL